MPEGIGYDIMGGEQKTDDVSAWKQFLMRPENLATALIFAAGVSSERRPEQGKLNKVLQSGVGALGFRGGLEQGVQQQRATKRDEQRAVERQAADIAAQQAATNQGAERNRLTGEQIGVQREGVDIQRQGLGIQQQQVNQAGRPRPLNPSENAENTAQANYYNAMANRANPQPQKDFYIQQALTQEMERAAQFGEAPDVPGALARGRQVQFVMDKFNAGQVTPDNQIIMTDEEARGFGLSTDTQAQGGQPVNKPAKGEASAHRRGTGKMLPRIFLNEESEQTVAVHELKKLPEFKDLPENTILDRVEEARNLAANKDALEKETTANLEQLLATYERVMAPTEARLVRATINKKKGVRTRTPLELR